MNTEPTGGKKQPPGKCGTAPRAARPPRSLDDVFSEMEPPDDRPETVELFANIKARLPELEKLLEEASGHWGYEDPVYRFYHQSWKVYDLQDRTREIVEALRYLAPKTAKPPTLNPWFEHIIGDGTGRSFELEHNQHWLQETRPILEAFFHARYFLEMVVRYGKELKEPPRMLPSGWAGVLYLYGLR